MSLANRAKAAGRAGSRQTLKLRASHSGGLGLRVSHRQSRDWQAPSKDLAAEAETIASYATSKRSARKDRHTDPFTGDRKRRRSKRRRRKHRR